MTGYIIVSIGKYSRSGKKTVKKRSGRALKAAGTMKTGLQYG